MNNEIQPVLYTAHEAARLVRRIDRRERWHHEIGLGQVQVGFPLEKTFTVDGRKEVILVNETDVTKKVGIVKEHVLSDIMRLSGRLRVFDPVLGEARVYKHRQKGRQIALARLSENYALGKVKQLDFQIALRDFRAIASQGEKPELREGIERLNEIRRAEKEKIENRKPKTTEPETVFRASTTGELQVNGQTSSISAPVVVDFQRQENGSSLQLQLDGSDKRVQVVTKIPIKSHHEGQDNGQELTIVTTSEIREGNDAQAEQDKGSEIAVAKAPAQEPWWSTNASVTPLQKTYLQALTEAFDNYDQAAAIIGGKVKAKDIKRVVNNANKLRNQK